MMVSTNYQVGLKDFFSTFSSQICELLKLVAQVSCTGSLILLFKNVVSIQFL